jgi:predicted phage terminase large subunit-like protein
MSMTETFYKPYPQTLQNSCLSQFVERINPEQQVATFSDWLRDVSPDWPWDTRHLVEIQRHLDMVTAGEINKLMIFMPPRHMKSESVTVRYSAWRLERDPRLKVVLAAYNQTLADKFSRKVRRIVRQRIPISDERSAVEDWETTQAGGLRAVGVGGGITGQGGNLIIIDDPIKSRREADSPVYREHVWDWYTDDLYSRREQDRDGNPASMILIMTRWHPDDLAGRILASDDGPNWTVLKLPAIATHNDPLGRMPGEALWPEQFPIEELEKIQAVREDERGFNALYQQEPQIEGGATFHREWWDGRNRYDADNVTVAAIGTALRWISWDTAMSEDDSAAYSAAVVGELGHDRVMRVREVYRARLSFPELVSAMEQLAEKYNHDGKLQEVIIEDKASGTSAIQTIRAQAPPWLRGKLVAWQPTGSKEYRASQASVWCRNGMIQLPMPAESVPWLAPFESELFSFPQSVHKDQVDSFTQLVLYLEPWIESGWTARRFRRDEYAA